MTWVSILLSIVIRALLNELNEVLNELKELWENGMHVRSSPCASDLKVRAA